MSPPQIVPRAADHRKGLVSPEHPGAERCGDIFAEWRRPGPGGDRRRGPLPTIGDPRIGIYGPAALESTGGRGHECQHSNRARQDEGEREESKTPWPVSARGAKAIVERGRRVLLLRLLGSPTATADDVRQALDLPEGLDARCSGAVPIGLARAGIIRSAGYVRSAPGAPREPHPVVDPCRSCRGDSLAGRPSRGRRPPCPAVNSRYSRRRTLDTIGGPAHEAKQTPAHFRQMESTADGSSCIGKPSIATCLPCRNCGTCFRGASCRRTIPRDTSPSRSAAADPCEPSAPANSSTAARARPKSWACPNRPSDDRMKRLEAMGAIAIQADTHYSIVTIVNWGLYQGKGGEGRHPTDTQPTPKQRATSTKRRPTDRQPTHTRRQRKERRVRRPRTERRQRLTMMLIVFLLGKKRARSAQELEKAGTFNLRGGGNQGRRNRNGSTCCGPASWRSTE